MQTAHHRRPYDCFAAPILFTPHLAPNKENNDENRTILFHFSPFALTAPSSLHRRRGGRAAKFNNDADGISAASPKPSKAKKNLKRARHVQNPAPGLLRMRLRFALQTDYCRRRSNHKVWLCDVDLAEVTFKSSQD